MITYNSISKSDFNAIAFVAQGDGTDTHLKVNISKPPFAIPFSGVLPAGVNISIDDDDVFATGSYSIGAGSDFLTVDFGTTPPPSTSTVGVTATSFYRSMVGNLTYDQIGEADFNTLFFFVKGNGVDTVLKANLSIAPFNVPYAGSLPDGTVVSVAGSLPATATITHDVVIVGDILTLTFANPLPQDTEVSVDIACLYNSL